MSADTLRPQPPEANGTHRHGAHRTAVLPAHLEGHNDNGARLTPYPLLNLGVPQNAAIPPVSCQRGFRLSTPLPRAQNERGDERYSPILPLVSVEGMKDFPRLRHLIRAKWLEWGTSYPVSAAWRGDEWRCCGSFLVAPVACPVERVAGIGGRSQAPAAIQ